MSGYRSLISRCEDPVLGVLFGNVRQGSTALVLEEESEEGNSRLDGSELVDSPRLRPQRFAGIVAVSALLGALALLATALFGTAHGGAAKARAEEAGISLSGTAGGEHHLRHGKGESPEEESKKEMEEKCSRASHGEPMPCDWTAEWSCPGQPQGAKGLADNDHSMAYKCCCGLEQWREATTSTTTFVIGEEADWRVVAEDGAVRVRAEASEAAEVLGERGKCHVVRASRRGDWLRLAEEPGYIRIRSGGTNGGADMQLVPTFLKIQNGLCSDVGWHPVREKDSCLVAASALNLDGDDLEFAEDHDGRPSACFWLGPGGGKQLAESKEKGHHVDPPSDKQPICSSSPEAVKVCTPVPTTTTLVPTTTTVPTVPPSTTTPPMPRDAKSPRLFCYSVVRATGYELDLMKEQLKKAVGIFACDTYALFSSPTSVFLGIAPAEIGGVPVNSYIFKEAAVGISKDNTAGNTLLFMNVWDAVREHGEWAKADFTMKVDPDAVLMPERLKDHLRPYMDWGATYIKNCNKVPGNPDFPMMFGALEVFSRDALQIYYDNQDMCNKTLPWQTWGEDFYMTKCLDKLNVVGLGDFKILGDNLCTGAKCGDGLMAAYHPFKEIATWFDCWGQASVAKVQDISPVPKPASVTKPPPPWKK
mmetsp:Transcript_137609/g.343444  ORF Transcript_137609/g.343444 Transcript_137609/m.343444 type:complete len:647 (+) Transcript_137609:77-2017(+)